MQVHYYLSRTDPLEISDFNEGDFEGLEKTKESLAKFVEKTIQNNLDDFVFDLNDSIEIDVHITDEDFAEYIPEWEKDNNKEPDHFEIWQKAVRQSREKANG